VRRFIGPQPDTKIAQKEPKGAYLPADIALDILMDILILDGTDNVDCIHQCGRHLDLGVFHNKDASREIKLEQSFLEIY
jgi:hypothetical protein